MRLFGCEMASWWSRSGVKSLGCWVVFLLGTGLASPAAAIWGDSEEGLGLDGSFRQTLMGSKGYSLVGREHEGQALGIFRLVAAGRPGPGISYEVHGVVNGGIRTASFSRAFRPERGRLRHRSVDTRHLWVDEADYSGDTVGALYLDRFNVKVRGDWFDLTVGRQAISLGTAYFWNPLDVFRPFLATQFDRDYAGGVDALRLDVPLGDFSGITVVGVMGRGEDFDVRWPRSSGLVRAYTTFMGWDGTLQVGRVFGGYQLGGGFVGDINGIEVRSEGAFFTPLSEDPLPAHFSGVLGTGYRFANTLMLEAEYFYNGAVETEDLKGDTLSQYSLVGKGRLLHRSGHLLGLTAQYELMAILHGGVSFIYSASDESLLMQPNLSLSLSDESDLLMGAMIGSGADETEFGVMPVVIFALMKSYF